MSCPNINSPEWKDLVELVGEPMAYRVFAVDPELTRVNELRQNFLDEKRKFSFAIRRPRNTSSRAKSEISETYEKVLKSIDRANSVESRSSSFTKVLNLGATLDSTIDYKGLTTPDGVINKFRQKAHIDSVEYIRKQAEELYKDTVPGTKILHVFSKDPLTKEEYIENRKRYSEYAAHRGKVMELILTIPLMTQGVEQDKAFEELDDLYDKINEYKEFLESILEEKKAKINDTWHGWALEDKRFPKRIFDILGIDIFSEDSTVHYTFQPTMKSDILETKAVLDMLIEHEPHRYSIIDFKAGFKFGQMSSSIPLKYYRQATGDISDNPQDIAKLQIMWEAMLVRINDPKATFQNLTAIWITEENSLYKSGIKFHVNPRDYIGIIVEYLKAEHPEKYEKLLLIDPELFDFRTYTAESTESKEFKKRFPDSAEDKLLNDVTQEIIYRQNYMDYNTDGERRGVDNKIRDLYDLMLDHNADNVAKTGMGLNKNMDFKTIRDLSLGEYWVGSFYNIKHAVISATLEVVHKQMLKATTDYNKDSLIFRSIMKNIIIDYAKDRDAGSVDRLQNLLADPFTEWSPALRKILGTFDQNILNGWIYVTKFDKESNANEMLYATTEEELLENAKDPKYKWILDSSGKVKKPYIQMMQFLNEKYGSVLDAKRKDSMWNTKLSYKLVHGKPVDISFGDEINSSEYRKRSPFKYKKGFFPKVAKLREEFPVLSFRNFFKKYFTNFYELAFMEYGNNDELIPIQGLTSKYNSIEGEFSMSLENQFETFMKSAYAKQHLTKAYALIEAIKIKNSDVKTGKVLLPRLQSWLTAQQEMALRGRRPQLTNTFSRSLPFSFSFASKDDDQMIKTMQTFDLGKFLQSFGQLTGYMRLGFNLPGGFKNTMGIMMSSFTEASKQSLMQRFYNDPKATRFINDFTTMGAAEFALALKPAIGIQIDGMKGNLNKNKAWVLMNKFGYIPSISPLRSETKYFTSKQTSLLSTDTALLPYSTSEEVMVAMYFIAQMNHIKIKQGPMKGKSMWDMYDAVVERDPITGVEYTDFKYKTDPTTGKPYVRGVITDSHGNIQEMTELTNKEIMAMHAIYEEKQGGFAQLDRTFIESSILGQMFVQFRRHLQSIIRHGLQSYGTSYIKGRYQDTKKLDANGNVIYEFTPKQIEGKWMTILGTLLYYIPLISQVFGKNTKIAKWTEGTFPKGLDSYALNKLDQGQLENLIDASMNIMLWAAMKACTFLAFGGTDKDDRATRLAQKIIDETLQHWKVWKIVQDIQQTPATLKVISSMIEGTATLSASVLLYGFNDMVFDIEEKEYMTRDNELRGLTEFEKNVPVFSSLRTTYLTALDFMGDEE